MEIVSTVSQMHKVSRTVRRSGRSMALVPTMGALHEGHLSLVRRARELADFTVVSIFVNPKQFGPQEDFSRYPRDFEGDARMLEPLGVDCIFAPDAQAMYPSGDRTYVEVSDWGTRLCGATRPGHFRGVTTVVAKLFNIVDPDIAVFGRKDAQQALIIQRMVRDLNFGTEIVVCPIVREHDGLALSSRNRYLGPSERKAATVLHRSLLEAQATLKSGQSDTDRIREAMKVVFQEEPLVRIDYIAMVDPKTLEPVQQARKDTLIAVAAFVGGTRLIDNWSADSER